MKFEGGVHRVQRVPKTEKQGRIHTSTMTVAILPQPTEVAFIFEYNRLYCEQCFYVPYCWYPSVVCPLLFSLNDFFF